MLGSCPFTRRLGALAAVVFASGVAFTAPAEAAPKTSGYSFSFKVFETYTDQAGTRDGNVLAIKLSCPADVGGVELAASVLLDSSDPDYNPNAVPAPGATTEDKFPEGFPLFLTCSRKSHTAYVDVFPNLHGYDREGDGPCIGYCYYDASPLLEAGQKVQISYSAYGASTVSGTAKARVKK